jgi:hypothetical protein
MPSDHDYILWSAQALQVFGRAMNITLPPFPGSPVTPPTPTPPTSQSISFTSGITVSGQIVATSQQRRLRVVPGTPVTFNAPAKFGMRADATDAWGAGLPYHTPVNPANSPFVLASGQVLLIAKKANPIADPIFLEEAVLVEALAADRIMPALLAWPSVIQGATAADVTQFLSETSWCPETMEGWAGRYGRAHQNCISYEPGYGAVIAERTSFGALLLCSTLSAALKQQVQDRLYLMAQDMIGYGIKYPADGGHGNGRYILHLIARSLGLQTGLTDADFSENQQLVAYSGVGNINGIGWRHHITDPVNMSSDYVNCCTANRWAGAALVANLFPQLNATSMWVSYTKGYLASQFNNTVNAWYFCKHVRSADLIRNNRQTLGY